MPSEPWITSDLTNGDGRSTRNRILFGSCTSLDYPQPLWPAIASRNATAFVWVGDAIYADRNIGMNFRVFPPKPIVQIATPEKLNQLYAQQLSHPGYREFLDTNITVFGTIDDHDYGANNGDKTYPYKRESAMAFMDFIGESSDSPIAKRARQGLGVYGVKVFDFDRPMGSELVPDSEAGLDPDVTAKPIETPLYSKKSVAVFVLDSRTNKTQWSTGRNKFFPNYDGDFLGERQWEWFETAISRSHASVNIIAQGLQVHSEKYPDGNIAEEWTRFPRTQQRLYNAVLQANVKAPILVSGDVHMAELFRKDCVDSLDSPSVRPLLEMTTSGMTHSWGTNVCSRRGSLPICRMRYTNFAAKTFMNFAHWISPWTELLESPKRAIAAELGGDEGAKTGKQYALDLNFGEFEFDWEQGTVQARILGKDERAGPLLSARWTLDQLTGTAPMPGGRASKNDYTSVRNVMIDNGVEPSQWTCAKYRGYPHPVHYAFGVVSAMSMFTFLLFLPLMIASFSCVLSLRRLLCKRRKAKSE